jgi:hypothetical protein
VAGADALDADGLRAAPTQSGPWDEARLDGVVAKAFDPVFGELQKRACVVDIRGLRLLSGSSIFRSNLLRWNRIKVGILTSREI